MKPLDFVIKFPIFWIFYAIFFSPLILAVLWTPSHPTWLGFIDALFGIALWVGFFVLAPWGAAVSAWRNAYKFESMIQSVAYVWDRVRVFLSFVPFFGFVFAPAPSHESKGPIEPE